MIHRTLRLLTALFLPLAAPCAARAATVMTIEGKAISGTIAGLENGAMLIKGSGADAPPTRVTLGDVASATLTWQDRQVKSGGESAAASRPAASTLWRVELADGDHVTAAVSEWSGNHVGLRLDQLPGVELSVPLEGVRAVWATSAARVKKAKALDVPAGGQDVAYIEKGNEVKGVGGVVTGFTAEALQFKFEGESHEVKLDRLAGITLAPHEVPRTTATYASFTLVDDDVVSGRILGMENGVFHVAPLAGGADAPAVDVPLGLMRGMEMHNGRLLWLGDLQPTGVSQVPYFDRVIPYQVNRSLTGGPLMLSDGPVKRGIAVHARCVLTYEIGGQYEKFLTKLGFQQPEGRAGCAAVRVLGDEKVLWEEGELKGDAKPTALELPVTGVKVLTLEVDYGKEQDVGDRVVWGDARLMKAADAGAAK